MPAGRRGRPGQAAHRAAPKDTAPAVEPVLDRRGRAPPSHAAAHLLNTRTVMSRRVPVSEETPQSVLASKRSGDLSLVL